MGERYFGGNAVDTDIEETAEAETEDQRDKSEVDLYKCHEYTAFSNASRMAATSGLIPVQISNAFAPW